MRGRSINAPREVAVAQAAGHVQILEGVVRVRPSSGGPGKSERGARRRGEEPRQHRGLRCRGPHRCGEQARFARTHPGGSFLRAGREPGMLAWDRQALPPNCCSPQGPRGGGVWVRAYPLGIGGKSGTVLRGRKKDRSPTEGRGIVESWPVPLRRGKGQGERHTPPLQVASPSLEASRQESTA